MVSYCKCVGMGERGVESGKIFTKFYAFPFYLFIDLGTMVKFGDFLHLKKRLVLTIIEPSLVRQEFILFYFGTAENFERYSACHVKNPNETPKHNILRSLWLLLLAGFIFPNFWVRIKFCT